MGRSRKEILELLALEAGAIAGPYGAAMSKLDGPSWLVLGGMLIVFVPFVLVFAAQLSRRGESKDTALPGGWNRITAVLGLPFMAYALLGAFAAIELREEVFFGLYSLALLGLVVQGWAMLRARERIDLSEFTASTAAPSETTTPSA